MNFNPRKRKVLASLIIPLALWIFLAITKNGESNLGQSLLSFHNFTNLFSSSNLIVFAIEFLIVYIIISLFQSKYSY